MYYFALYFATVDPVKLTFSFPPNHFGPSTWRSGDFSACWGALGGRFIVFWAQIDDFVFNIPIGAPIEPKSNQDGNHTNEQMFRDFVGIHSYLAASYIVRRPSN